MAIVYDIEVSPARNVDIFINGVKRSKILQKSIIVRRGILSRGDYVGIPFVA